MDAIMRYFRSPAAVAGLILLLIVIAMAVATPPINSEIRAP